MAETRKLAAILAADVVGFSRLTRPDEDWDLGRAQGIQRDLIGPTITIHQERVVKRIGDGALVEFRSVADAARCTVELLNSALSLSTGLQ
jgi:adenylate cyclase